MAQRFEIGDTVQRAVQASLNVVSGTSITPTTETVLTPGGDLSVTVKDLQGNNLTVYAAETGSSTVANPLTTDSDGRISGWVEAPDYDLTISGTDVVSSTQNVRLSPAGAVNVKSYGARGDNSTDDYAAFQAAHDALPTGGGTILVPPGTYLTSATWNISKTCLVQGAGGGSNIGGATPEAATIIKPASGVTGMRLYSASSPTNPPVVLRDFVLISRSSGAGTDDGIQIQTHGCVLDHISCAKFGEYGFSVDTGGPVGNSNNSHFRACRASLCQSHGFYISGANSQAMLFEACDASTNSGWGFYTGGAVASATNTFLKCHSATNTLGAVYDNGSSNQYLGHYVEGGTGNNVTFDTNSSGLYWLNPGAYVGPTITDNGSNNTILNPGAGNVPTWNRLRISSDLAMVGTAKSILAQSYAAASANFALVRVSTDSNDRVAIRPDGIRLSDGTISPQSAIAWYSSGVVGTDQDWAIAVAGKGLRVKEGSNARMGTATLVAGTVTVNTTAVATGDRIFLTEVNTGGTAGFLSYTISNGTSFTVTSSSGTDTRTFNWLIVRPA